MENKKLWGLTIIAITDLLLGGLLFVYPFYSFFLPKHPYSLNVQMLIIGLGIGYIGFLTLVKNRYAKMANIILAILGIMSFLGSSLSNDQSFELYFWLLLFYSIWVIWYLTTPKVKELFCAKTVPLEQEIKHKRPRTVTVLAWISIIVSISAGCMLLAAWKSFMLVGGYLILSLGIVSGITGMGMLKGQNWSRFLFIIIAALIMYRDLTASHTILDKIAISVVFLIIVFVLFRPAANQYFIKKSS